MKADALKRRFEKLLSTGEYELPGWMRGMECLFGKFVVRNLLLLALLELRESATPEQVNKMAEEEVEHPTHDDGGMKNYELREAVTCRRWFAEHGRVEDALTRLCGIQGEITIQSIEQRLKEVSAAIAEQNAEIGAEIAAREAKSRVR